MIDALVTDLLRETARRLEEAAPSSIEAVRAAAPLVAFSEGMRAETDALKAFLLSALYRHPQVMRMTGKARRIVRELFEAFRDEPRLLPAEHGERVRREGVRAIADYIAGMTDRYAVREHRRLFAVGEN